MALSDGFRSPDQIVWMEEILSHAREKRRQMIQEDEAARSEERQAALDDETRWSYVVVADEYVRITGCTTAAKTLVIPVSIEDKPVLELAIDACSYLNSVTKIVCSPQIESIAACAFRMCKNLEVLKLPCDVDTYDSSWVRGCTRLRELELPGGLERITASIFDVGELKRLVLGRAAESFIPGVFAKSKLESIEIASENPHLTSDGKAVFAHDGTHLRVLAIPSKNYTVPEAVTVIETKAFGNREELEVVDLPEGITEIQDHAFSYSGLRRFVAPKALQSIGVRAFFRCRKLEELKLNEGLRSIGDDAFTGSGISVLEAPSSLESLGNSIAADTAVTFSGDNPGFTIAPGGILELDRWGGLYRNEPDGKHFVRMLDDEIVSYRMLPETRAIDPHSFTRHSHIREVGLPEGLREIGDAAFRDCHELAIADFPSTLERVGNEAFLDTSLSRVHIPRNLKYLGEIALITYGAHNGDAAPSLTSVEAEEGNERFFTVPGLLIERRERGGAHVVVYADGVESVHIPSDVTAIDPYAFGGARHLRELYLSDRIHRVGMRGLSLDCLVHHFHIDLAEPIEGRTYFDLYFPESARSAHEIQLAFNLSSSVDVAMLLKHYDSAIVNMHDFDKKSQGSSDEFDAYGQAKLALERLRDPVLMSKTNKTMLMQTLAENLSAVCEAIARHDDREAVDDLLELGLLNKDNLLDIIDRIGKLQDAAMTGYLLEVKRRFFKQSAVDFDL